MVFFGKMVTPKVKIPAALNAPIGSTMLPTVAQEKRDAGLSFQTLPDQKPKKMTTIRRTLAEAGIAQAPAQSCGGTRGDGGRIDTVSGGAAAQDQSPTADEWIRSGASCLSRAPSLQQ